MLKNLRFVFTPLICFFKRNTATNRFFVFSVVLAFLLVGVGNESKGQKISQIYGGGGNTSATFRNDFIEIFNNTGSTITLTGMSVQYASATGTTWSTVSLTGTLTAGRYYLIQLGSGGAVGTLLPTADATNTGINMSASAGKVVLASQTTAYTVGCPSSNVIDFVGFGTTADCREGTGTTNNAPAHSNTTAIFRGSNGCTDNNINSTDFATPTTPNPRNTASSPNLCGATPSLTGAATATPFTTTYGTPSTAQNFSISGANLTANLIATAPTGFEVTSNGGTNWGSTATFTQSGGNASGTLGIRLAATATVTGTYNGQNIVLSSTGATPVNIVTAASGNSVSVKALTITGLSGSNKIYNGNNTAAITGTPVYNGLENSETFPNPTLISTGTFASANVGDGITITGSSNYAPPSTNYTVTQPSLSANITQQAVTIKANDVTKALGATLTGGAGSAAYTITSGSFAGTEGNGVTVTITYGTGAAAGDPAGTYTGSVVPSAATGGTFLAGNYNINYNNGDITVTSTTPVITGSATADAFTTTYGTPSTAQTFSVSGTDLTANITATAPTGFEVSSDGTNFAGTAIFTQSGGTASGTLSIRLAATAAVTGTNYNSQNIVLSSTLATPVNIVTAASGNSVSAKALTITGLSGSNKIYNGNNTAAITGTPVYNGLENSETFANPTLISTGTFASANVGDGIAITGSSNYAAPSTNYTVTQPSISANITLRPVTIKANNVIKTFGATLTGGSGSSAFAITSGSFVGTEGTGVTVTITYGTGAASGAAAGTYTGSVVPSDATGGTFTAGNYNITYSNGDITIPDPNAAQAIWPLTSNATPSVSGNITAGNQTGGSSIGTMSYSSNGVTSNGWAGSAVGVIDQNEYYQFSVSPSTNYTFTVSSIATTNNLSSQTATGILQYSYSSLFTSPQTIGSTFALSSSSVTTNFTGLNIPVNSGQTLYFRLFVYNASGNTLTGSQTVRSKDFTINGTSIQLLAPPTLIPATGATVDNAFNVTFTDDPASQTWVSGGGHTVTVGGTTLTNGFSIANGAITFTPSASLPVGLLQTAGTKSIVVSKSGYTNTTSISQTINPGLPAALTVSPQPTAPTISGGTLATQPAVTVRDQYGNAVGAGITVNAAVTSGQALNWTLGGTTSAITNASGVATFTDLTATNLGTTAFTTATITFTPSPGSGTVNSNTFSIPAPATKLVITAISPTSPTAGAGFSVTVQAQNAANAATSVLTSTGITLTTNGNAGSISGTTTGTINAGSNSVTITGVILPTAGTGATITATQTSGSPTLAAGTSNAFNVLQAASYLTFENVPTTGSTNTNLASFTVSARRLSDGSVDQAFTGSITISKNSGPGAGVLSGTLSVNAVNGVATFSAAQFNLVGTYTLLAASGSLTNATSDNIVVSLANATVILWSSAGGSAWLTTTNWTGSAVPSSTQVAQFGVNPTPTTVANINGGTTTAGAIEINSNRLINLIIGNNSGSATNGTLTLNGVVVNGSPNIILRNNSVGNLTIQNTGSTGSASNTMALALGNLTDNVVNIDGSGGITISSIINGSGRSLTKAGSGSGVLTLSGANTYTGGTTITTGTLQLGAAGVLADAGTITLNGGTFRTGATAGFIETVGTLNLNANSNIALGTGDHTLTFANSSGVTWAGSTLTITGWTGAAGQSNNTGAKISFSSSSGLSATQLAKISFSGYPGLPAILLNTGELVPAPLPQGSLTNSGDLCAPGGNAQLIWTATNGTGPFTVVYNDGTADRTKFNVVSGTGFDVNTNPVTSTTTYTLVSVTDANNATRSSGFTGGGSTTVNIYPNPTTFNVTGGGSYCSGGSGVPVGLSGSESGNSYSLYLNGNYITFKTGTGSAFNFDNLFTTAAGTYTVLAENPNGCISTMTGSATVTVNPTASITAMTNSACSGAAFSSTPVNGTNGVVPSGTTYSWSAPSVTGGITGGASGSGATSITGTLTNPTNTAQTATYTVTPLSGSCTGATFTVTVTVNPKPAITAMTNTACSGVAFSSTPVNGTNGLVPTGTTYSWSAPSVTGGITGGASGSGATSITGTLSNPTNTAQTATYTVTPLSNGCTGSTFTVTVTITNNTFTGTGNWTDNARWSCGNPPATGDVFTIDGVATLNANFIVSGTMNIASNGTFIVASTNMLTVNGIANFNSRPVLFKSDAFGTAIMGNSSGTINGATNVTIERWVQSKRAWRMVTTPLKDNTSNKVFDQWQNAGTSSPTYGVEIWGPSQTGTPSSNGTGLANGTSHSMLKLVNSAWSNVINTKDNSSPLFNTGVTGNTNPNNAFLLFITSPFKNGAGLIANFSGAEPTTLRATGTLITGAANYTQGSTAGQFHLVPNPYAAPVNPASITSTNAGNYFWVWDPALGGPSSFGGYISYSRITPVGFSIPPSTGTYIQSGQAFFAQATPAATSIAVNFTESMKGTAANNGNNFRIASPINGGGMATRFNNGSYELLRVTLQRNNSGVYDVADGAVGVFYNTGSNAVDANDGPKLSNTNDNLMFRRDNNSLTFEHRQLVDQKDTLYMRLSNTVTAPYRFVIEGSNFDVAAGLRAWIQDSYLNSETPVYLYGSTTFNFNVDGTVAASSGDRFRIVFRADAATGVTDPDLTRGIKVYPNPAIKGSAVQLEFNNRNAGVYNITVYNINGAQVLNRVVRHNGGSNVYPVTVPQQMPSGAYLVEVTDAAGKRATYKISIQ